MDLKPLIMLFLPILFLLLPVTMCVEAIAMRGRTAERKSDSTRRTWYKQTLRMYYSPWLISLLIPEKQYPVIYIIQFSNNLGF